MSKISMTNKTLSGFNIAFDNFCGLRFSDEGFSIHINWCYFI